MTMEEFKKTLEKDSPPAVSPLLLALWHDARGNWDDAHRIAQDVDDANGALVHAYLHRKEGDLSNARYWYQRATEPEATDSLKSEWARIGSRLLQKQAGRVR
jgi:hypothetical protein